MKKVFLGIGLFGMMGFAMAQQTTPQDRQQRMQERQAKMEQKHQERMAEMQKDLNLSPDQIQKINVMHQARKNERAVQMQQRQEMRKQKMAEMDKRRKETDDQMRQILNPDQYAKWQAKKQAKMQENKGKWGKDGFGKHGRKGGMMKDGGFRKGKHTTQPVRPSTL